MKSLNRADSSGWLALILAVATVTTLGIHLTRASGPVTKTETALFGILEFLFSIAFAWILSRISFRREFEEGQRRFAIAAYRRVREIERTADRLLIRTSERSGAATPELSHEIDVIRQIAIGIQDAVRSSIADWGEIIGDEITAVEKIEEIRTKKSRLLMETDSRRLQQQPNPRDLAISESLKELNQQLTELRKGLPASLQLLEESDESDNTWGQTTLEFVEELQSNNSIELLCFWEPDRGFERLAKELRIGEKLNFAIGDIGPRIAALVARDESGKSVGAVFNTSMASPYHEFMAVVATMMGSSKFSGEVVSFDEQDTSSERVYFRVKLAPDLKRWQRLN